MAFVRLASTPRYTCAAADAKPTSGIEIGATALETDTGKLYIFDGTNWIYKPSLVQVEAGAAKIGAVAIDQTTPGTTNAVVLTGSIAETATRPNVTTTSGVVLAANANRKYALMRNPNPVDVFVSKGATAVVGQQRAIPANGGVWTMSAALGNLSTGAIVAVHGAAGVTYQLEVIEGV